MTVMGTAFMLLTLWWVPYLVDAAELSRLQASAVLFDCSLVLLIAAPSMAWLSDTVFRSRRRPMLVCSVLIVLVALPWLFFPGSMSFGMHAAQAVAFGFLAAAAALLNLTMVKETFPPRLLGTVTGCVNMIYPVWTAVLQILFGLLLSSGLDAGKDAAAAYGLAFTLVAVSLAAGCACAFFMKETYNSPQ
jgi:sugar phosphate permease